MKPNLQFTERNGGRALSAASKSAQSTGEPEALSGNGVRERFRRLKWNELVRQGDFVANGNRRLELWEGPGGFRADAFVKPIFRRRARRLTGTKKAQ